MGSSLVSRFDSGNLRTYFEYEYNIENLYYWWGTQSASTGPIANTYGNGQYPYTYYGNILSSALGSEGIGYTLGAILNENDGSADNVMLRFLQLNSLGWGVAGTPGYPFSKQDLVWASLGRIVKLPRHIGSLYSEIGYLQSVAGSGLPSGFAATLTWSKFF